jgi:biopolymer transport protein ExbB/TolQ
MNLANLTSNRDRFLVVGLAAGGIALGALWLNAFNSNATLRRTLDEQKVAIEKKDQQLLKVNKSLADLQQRQAGAEQTCSAQQAQLKQSVAAFAKQAGACEELRQKLHVAGYTS